LGCHAADSVGARDDYAKQTDNNNEEIVYFTASVVILLMPNVNKQRLYLGHEQQVISVAVSTEDGSILASGELGHVPAIHVWSRKSLETINVIKGMHV
jgi:WD40 repeat protein